MNFKNKKSIIILIFSLLIIMSIVSCIFMFNGDISLETQGEKNITNTESNLNKEVDEKIDSSENLTDEQKEEKKSEPLEDKMQDTLGQGSLYYKNAIKIGDENKEEYPKEKTDALYKELIKLSQKADYLKISQRIENELITYKFHEEYNWCIGNVYNDANLMLNVLDMPSEERGHVVKNQKDPIMLTVGTLMISEKARRDVIISDSSLSPIFEGAVTLINCTDVTDESKNDKYVAEVYNNMGSVRQVLKIDFEVENKPLMAYVAIGSDGYPNLFKIVAEEGLEHSFKPISYWKELLP